MDSFGIRSGPGNGANHPLDPRRRRRRRSWGERLLARLRDRWLLQTAAVLLGAVILGLLAVLLLDRV